MQRVILACFSIALLHYCRMLCALLLWLHRNCTGQPASAAVTSPQDAAGLVPCGAGHLPVAHLRHGGQHGVAAREACFSSSHFPCCSFEKKGRSHALGAIPAAEGQHRVAARECGACAAPGFAAASASMPAACEGISMASCLWAPPHVFGLAATHPPCRCASGTSGTCLSAACACPLPLPRSAASSGRPNPRRRSGGSSGRKQRSAGARRGGKAARAARRQAAGAAAPTGWPVGQLTQPLPQQLCWIRSSSGVRLARRQQRQRRMGRPRPTWLHSSSNHSRLSMVEQAATVTTPLLAWRTAPQVGRV